MPASDPSWFAVLPDTADAQDLATALHVKAENEIQHPSGRPWLLGSWSAGQLVLGEAGAVRLALLGQHGISRDALCRHAERVDSVAHLDRLNNTLPGSFHLLAAIGDVLYGYGSLTGLRRLYHLRSGRTVVLADHAAVLAEVCHAPLDRERLATRLLDVVPYPIDERPLWQGVAQVPNDHGVVIGRDGSINLRRWWSPPEPVMSLEHGAIAFRDALSASVRARTEGHDLVTADLGGLDSTAVCSVAARGGAPVVAFTAGSPDPLADDEWWATRTVAGLGIEHHVITQDEMPLLFDGLSQVRMHSDEPLPVTDSSRWQTVIGRAIQRGSRMHLCGAGGDELLYGSVAHLHTLVRTHPLAGWRLLRGFMAKYRWDFLPTLAQLRDGRSYGRWLSDTAGRITDRQSGQVADRPRLEWFFSFRMPPWATLDAVDAVRRQVTAEAASAQPLSPRRGQHRELAGMRSTCDYVRHHQQAAARAGMTLAAPYYDNPVITAAFSVRAQDRISPWRYKPLIVAAMKGIVPEESRVRQTKPLGTFAETGLRRNRAELMALCEDSRLAELGLIDADRLRAACRGTMHEDIQLLVKQTASAELWLRAWQRSPLSS